MPTFRKTKEITESFMQKSIAHGSENGTKDSNCGYLTPPPQLTAQTSMAPFPDKTTSHTMSHTTSHTPDESSSLSSTSTSTVEKKASLLGTESPKFSDPVTEEPADINSTLTPHDNDVLCGRGGSVNNHIGNERYRTLVHQRKRVYLTARFKREKRLIASSIVQSIRNTEPPGRFLSRDGRTGVWMDIGNVKSRDKTSQALREGAPEIRKEMENDRLRAQQQQQQQGEEEYEDEGMYADYEAVDLSPNQIGGFSPVGSPPSHLPHYDDNGNECQQQSHHENGAYKRQDDRHPFVHHPAASLRPALKKPTHHPASACRRQTSYSPQRGDTLTPSPSSAWTRHGSGNGSDTDLMDPHHLERSMHYNNRRPSVHFDGAHTEEQGQGPLPPQCTPSPHSKSRAGREAHNLAQYNSPRPMDGASHRFYSNDYSCRPPSPISSSKNHQIQGGPHTYSPQPRSRASYPQERNPRQWNCRASHSENLQDSVKIAPTSSSWDTEVNQFVDQPDPLMQTTSMDMEMEVVLNERHGEHQWNDTPPPNANASRAQQRHVSPAQVRYKDPPYETAIIPSSNELTESRQDDYWSSRIGCSALTQLPQDWTSVFYPAPRNGSFEGEGHSHVSMCGMELCSVGSIGGGSLCNVFIEDDPGKQQPGNSKDETIPSLLNQVKLKHTSSWGSRSVLSPFGSDIGSEVDKVDIEPLPIHSNAFDTSGLGHQDVSDSMNHDYVYSWDGRGAE